MDQGMSKYFFFKTLLRFLLLFVQCNGEYHLLLCRSQTFNLTYFQGPRDNNQCWMHLFSLDFDKQHVDLQTNLLGIFSAEKVINFILDYHFYHHSYKRMRVKNSRKENVYNLKKVTEEQIRDAKMDNENHAQIKEHAKNLGKQKTKKENLVLIKKDAFHNSGFIFGHLFEVEKGVYMTTKKTIEEAMTGKERGRLHLTEEFVLQTHTRIMRDMITSRAGKYRNFNLHMGGECSKQYNARFNAFFPSRFLLKLCSDRAKANANAKIFFDLFRILFYLFRIRVHFRSVWTGSKNVVERLINIRVGLQLFKSQARPIVSQWQNSSIGSFYHHLFIQDIKICDQELNYNFR